jgi:hypothetical protein
MYDCPRSEGTIDHCNASKRSELLALAEKEIEKRQATGEVTGEVAEATGEGAAGFSLEKREELQAAEASGEVQDCGALCRYHEDVCVRVSARLPPSF